MRVGVLGGTFDPVHVGHLVAAVDVRARLALDRVLLVVAADPWQKRGQVVAPATDRLAMVEAAVTGIDGLEASAIEMARRGPTYTVETLEQLRAPGWELFLIIGSDVVGQLHTWHRAEDLPALATLVIVDRGGDQAIADRRFQVERVHIPRLDIASHELRHRAAAGLPLDGLVPPGAVRVLRERRLYTPKQ